MKTMKGFTLIELLVTISLMAIVAAIGVPMLYDWIGNQAVFGAAQSVQNGIRAAQAEAFKRNVITEFSLTNATVTPTTSTADAPAVLNGRNWVARTVELNTGSPPSWATGQNAGDAYPNINLTGGTAALGPSLFFDGRGRVSTSAAAFEANLLGTNYVYRFERRDEGRAYCVYVTPGSSVRMCNPGAGASDPRACTVALTADECPAPEGTAPY